MRVNRRKVVKGIDLEWCMRICFNKKLDFLRQKCRRLGSVTVLALQVEASESLCPYSGAHFGLKSRVKYVLWKTLKDPAQKRMHVHAKTSCGPKQ